MEFSARGADKQLRDAMAASLVTYGQEKLKRRRPRPRRRLRRRRSGLQRRRRARRRRPAAAAAPAEAEAFESDPYGPFTEEDEEEPAKVTKHRGVILLRTNRGKTGYLGVTKKDGKYQAQYRDKYLGIFDDMLDAAAEVSARRQRPP